MTVQEVWTAEQYRAHFAETRACLSVTDSVAPSPRRPSEYEEQVHFFALVDLLAKRHPSSADDLLDVFSTSSGGKRDRATAGKLREAGQRAGIPDIEVFVPKHGCHGLVIELKPLGSGKASRAQRDRLDRLCARGYSAHLIHGWLAAGKVLCTYLSLPWPSDAEPAVELVIALRIFQRKVARKKRRRAVFASSL